MFAKNITHSATWAFPAERDYTGLQTEEERKERRRGGGKRAKVTSLPAHCGSAPRGSGFQAGAGAVPRGAEEGRRPLQAQSKIASAGQRRDTETLPSCDHREQQCSQSTLTVKVHLCKFSHLGINKVPQVKTLSIQLNSTQKLLFVHIWTLNKNSNCDHCNFNYLHFLTVLKTY